MLKKNKDLKSISLVKKNVWCPYFSKRDIDLLYRMITICIKFRISDNISINQMYRFYRKVKELS